MSPFRGLAPVLVLSAVVAAQTRPVFEVASIKPSPEQLDRADVGVHISGSQVRISDLSLKDYISIAYRLPSGQVSGPDWIGQQRFDIAAKIPDGSRPDQVPEMMQQLLADRFELKTHRDAREFPVYALIVGKNGPKLQESAATPPDAPDARPGTVNVAASGSSNGVAMDLGGGAFLNLANNRLEMHNVTMVQVAASITRMLDRQAIDMTNLTARYDLTLELTPEDYNLAMMRSAVNAGVALPPQALRMLDSVSGEPFSGALQKFGLTLESRKAPLDVVVVDSARRTPIEN